MRSTTSSAVPILCLLVSMAWKGSPVITALVVVALVAFALGEREVHVVDVTPTDSTILIR
jgi:hypothetical protein